MLARIPSPAANFDNAPPSRELRPYRLEVPPIHLARQRPLRPFQPARLQHVCRRLIADRYRRGFRTHIHRRRRETPAIQKVNAGPRRLPARCRARIVASSRLLQGLPCTNAIPRRLQRLPQAPPALIVDNAKITGTPSPAVLINSTAGAPHISADLPKSMRSWFLPAAASSNSAAPTAACSPPFSLPSASES